MIAFLSAVLMYLMFGVLSWQFWFLTVITYFNKQEDKEKFEKLIDAPITLFIILWPLSLFYSIWIIYTIERK